MGGSSKLRVRGPGASAPPAPLERSSGRLPVRLPRRDLLWSFGVGAVLAVVYLRTLLPTVSQGDTAKFGFVGHLLGVPHVPGYPLYMLVSFAFSHLVPVGSLAYRANLLSAVLGVAAVVVLFRTLLHLDVRRPIAAAGALLFGATVTFWSQTVIAEVYALTILLLGVGLYFLVRWSRWGRDVDLLWAIAVFAVSVGHSLYVYLLAPGLVAFVLLTDHRAVLRWRILLAAALFLALGYAQYGYMVWRTLDPTTAYLETPITGLRTFWHDVTGVAFRPFMWRFGLAELRSQRLPMFARLLWREWGLLLPVAAYGLVRLRWSALNLLLVVSVALTIVFGLEYAIPDVQVAFIPAYFLIAVWIAVGLEGIVRRLPGRAATASGAAALLLPALFVAANLSTADQSRATAHAQTAEEALAAMPDGSVLFSPDFSHYTTFGYYTMGEGLERTRNVFAYPYTTAEMPVGNYCRGEVPLYLWTERKTLAPGLAVYAYGEDLARVLRGKGLGLQRVTGELFAVSCPAPTPAPSPVARA